MALGHLRHQRPPHLPHTHIAPLGRAPLQNHRPSTDMATPLAWWRQRPSRSALPCGYSPSPRTKRYHAPTSTENCAPAHPARPTPPQIQRSVPHHRKSQRWRTIAPSPRAFRTRPARASYVRASEGGGVGGAKCKCRCVAQARPRRARAPSSMTSSSQGRGRSGIRGRWELPPPRAACAYA